MRKAALEELICLELITSSHVISCRAVLNFSLVLLLTKRL